MRNPSATVYAVAVPVAVSLEATYEESKRPLRADASHFGPEFGSYL